MKAKKRKVIVGDNNLRIVKEEELAGLRAEVARLKRKHIVNNP